MSREHRRRDPPAEPGAVPQNKARRCLMCRDNFMSEWSGERVCVKCKTKSTWREGVAPPFGTRPG